MTDEQTVERALSILRDRAAGDGVPLADPGVLVAHAALTLMDERVESFLLYWLDTERKFIGCDLLAKGGETEAAYSRRELVRLGLNRDASFCITAHNHPNGDATPSEQDKACAGNIARALGTVGIWNQANFVVAGNDYADIAIGDVRQLIADEPKDESTPCCPRCGHQLTGEPTHAD